MQHLRVRWLSGNLLCILPIDDLRTTIRHVNNVASRCAGRRVEICSTDDTRGPFDPDMRVLLLLPPGRSAPTAWVTAVPTPVILGRYGDTISDGYYFW